MCKVDYSPRTYLENSFSRQTDPTNIENLVIPGVCLKKVPFFLECCQTQEKNFSKIVFPSIRKLYVIKIKFTNTKTNIRYVEWPILPSHHSFLKKFFGKNILITYNFFSISNSSFLNSSISFFDALPI